MNPTTSPANCHPLSLAHAFSDVLSPEQLQQAIADENITFRQCTFTPTVTFWTFFTRIFHARSSCRNALLKLAAARFAIDPQDNEPLDTGTYCKARQRLPETITVRRFWAVIERPGFRTKGLHRVTTLLDATKYSLAELAELYKCRWQVELHFRTLKCDLTMGILTCKTPAMVRKELAMHTIVFNAIRAVMVAAGVVVKRAPYRLSFTAAWKAIESFTELLSNPLGRMSAWRELLRVIGSQEVDDRPNRVEPRVVKRRPKDCKYMTKPRKDYPRVTKTQP